MGRCPSQPNIHQVENGIKGACSNYVSEKNLSASKKTILSQMKRIDNHKTEHKHLIGELVPET